MFRAAIKNTFLVFEEIEQEDTEYKRCRSLDVNLDSCPRELAVGTKSQLAHLNELLVLPSQDCLASMRDINAKADLQEGQGTSVEELHDLRNRLAMACQSSALYHTANIEAHKALSLLLPEAEEAPTVTPNLSLKSVLSNYSNISSLSSLKPIGDKGGSNTSLNTMVPEENDNLEEDADDDDAPATLCTVEQPEQQSPRPIRVERKFANFDGRASNFDAQSDIFDPGRLGRTRYLHKCVPKSVDFAQEYASSGQDKAPVTLMIRNIPYRFTRNDFIADLERLGFAGKFDFLYLPIDKGTMCSVGYAFVNFIDTTWAALCMEKFRTHRFRVGSRHPGRLAAVSVAHVQGLEANLKHYANAAVSTSGESVARPVFNARLIGT